MSKIMPSTTVEMICIDRINILNPRVRNQANFRGIAENIVRVGLKRPITVTPCRSGAANKEYDLVCGQGRLEAFLAVGQTEIPAIVIKATEHEALVMSLVENLARRQHRASELFHGISLLQEQGYDARTISTKTGLAVEYIIGILTLLEKGEERLLSAVEAGHVPITLAMAISDSPEDEQRALHDLYESNQLRGNKLLKAKKLIATRRRAGKNLRGYQPTTRVSLETPIKGQDVLKIYKKEVNRKRVLIRKAEMAGNNLLFVTEALKRLFQDVQFTNLLRAEGLTDMPLSLSAKIELWPG